MSTCDDREPRTCTEQRKQAYAPEEAVAVGFDFLWHTRRSTSIRVSALSVHPSQECMHNMVCYPMYATHKELAADCSELLAHRQDRIVARLVLAAAIFALGLDFALGFNGFALAC